GVPPAVLGASSGPGPRAGDRGPGRDHHGWRRRVTGRPAHRLHADVAVEPRRQPGQRPRQLRSGQRQRRRQPGQRQLRPRQRRRQPRQWQLRPGQRPRARRRPWPRQARRGRPVSPDTRPGEQPLVGGRCALGELLGRGGMAEVRKGTDTRLGRVVAVKRLRTDLASDITFQARFRREAQSAASLNHPSIVAVYDTGEEPAADGSGVSQPYIVMEYVAGRTLRDILREGRKILPERALEITSGVLSALDYSHRAGIIHRDIKPGNVMLTPSGDVKVMDFGIARAMSDSHTMTQTAAVVGTAQYLSPEQARGETVDSRSDFYSAGCLLYELLTGRPPFV